MSTTTQDLVRDAMLTSIESVSEDIAGWVDGRLSAKDRTIATLEEACKQWESAFDHNQNRIAELEKEVAILQQSLARAERTVTL